MCIELNEVLSGQRFVRHSSSSISRGFHGKPRASQCNAQRSSASVTFRQEVPGNNQAPAVLQRLNGCPLLGIAEVRSNDRYVGGCRPEYVVGGLGSERQIMPEAADGPRGNGMSAG